MLGERVPMALPIFLGNASGFGASPSLWRVSWVPAGFKLGSNGLMLGSNWVQIPTISSCFHQPTGFKATKNHFRARSEAAQPGIAAPFRYSIVED
jgi:hypothetical protein